MHILLTNDDGFHALGLAALHREFGRLGDVAVVAPMAAQSGVGHGISVQRPLLVERIIAAGELAGWAVDGRPADCVKLAILHLLDRRPDYVVSGINAGLNTSMYTLYSGTVAAAAEAAVFFGIPSMAVSLECSDDMDFDGAARIARQVFEQYVAARPANGSCINVNVPALAAGGPRGVRVCPRSTLTTRTIYRREADERGRQVFHFEGGDPEKTHQPNTDSQAVLDGYVSITPLRFDCADDRLMKVLLGCDWTLPLE